ncbi:MAG: cell envelope integrity protein CreD [Burkholderiaceae bacterium]|jgi:inner membrane protein|nr:cell envelope integrity protein CreD [Burkholderiaceae bacterium]
MQKKLAIKLALIVFLGLLLLVPLGMIESQISARGKSQQEVLDDIAESSARAQVLGAPVIMLRYRERVQEVRRDEEKKHEYTVTEVRERVHPVAAQNFLIKGGARVESRKRGIYSANLYHLDLQLSGSFEIPPNMGMDTLPDLLEAPKAFLVMRLSDLRGIVVDPQVTINDKPHRFTSDSTLFGGNEVFIALGSINPEQAWSYKFEFPLKIMGTQQFSLTPTAQQTQMDLTSDWPHPSFGGRFSPQERQIDPDGKGFAATWQVSHLARNFDEALKGGERMSVDFIEPVNIYLKAERAVKYGILFIVLTFSAFFLMEIIRKSPIHPLQYAMVGLAMAIFFLLLIALSEHISFELAYLASALGCIGVISVYLIGVLKNQHTGLLFGAGLTVLYGILYGLLLSEDSALLMGSLLLFAALAAVMLLTRHVNWYTIDYGNTDAKEQST